MMDARVVGADGLGDALVQVLRNVPKMEPREVGDIILAAARNRTPVATGQLRASGRAAGMTVAYTAPYAAPIHWGWRKRHIEPNPWLIKGTESSADAWLGAFTDALQESINEHLP